MSGGSGAVLVIANAKIGQVTASSGALNSSTLIKHTHFCYLRFDENLMFQYFSINPTVFFRNSLHIVRSQFTQFREYAFTQCMDLTVLYLSGSVSKPLNIPGHCYIINVNFSEPPEINRIGVNFTVSLAGLKAQRSDNNKVQVFTFVIPVF